MATVQDAPPTVGLPAGHPAPAASAARSASIAAGMPSGAVPAPCAMSFLPPPRPAIVGRNALARSPAARPAAIAAGVTRDRERDRARARARRPRPRRAGRPAGS